MKKESCDFCNILGEPYRVINHNRYVTSFLSNPRLVRGHALVIPNRHLISLAELTDEEALAIHHEASRLGALMLGSLANGIDIWQKTRPDMEEGPIKRDHIHTHVLPSQPGDHLYDQGIDWGNPERWTAITEADRLAVLGYLRPEGFSEANLLQ